MVLLTTAASVVPISYHSIGGSTMTAGEMISVDDVVDDRHSTSVLVPIVRSRTVTPLAAFAGWLDPHVDVHPEQHRSDRDRSLGRSLMTESGDIATMVVARRLGLDPGSVHVRLDTHGLGGPSAGLPFALEVFDFLSPGEITSGRLIAATGTLDVDGDVGAIGGVRHKAFAAREAGASVFLVPSDNYWAAVAAVPDLRVIAVSTFDEAVEVLRQLWGEP